MNKNIIKTGLLAAVVALSGCDSFLDINTSPNSPSEDQLTTSLIFPGAEMSLCTSYCGELRMHGGYYAEHFGGVPGNSNYNSNSRFEVGTGSGNGVWYNLYIKGLNNLQTVIEKADAEGDRGTKLAATVVRTATYATLVDMFGEVPYSEAFDVENHPMPHFDNGKDIYKGILDELDAALSGVLPTDNVCTNFLFPNGMADGWIKTANALKLRMLMRISNVENVQSQIAALIAEDNFPTSDVAWKGCWSDNSNNASPYYRMYGNGSYSYTKKNISYNLTIVNTLEDCNDPRLSAFMNRNTKGEYFGGMAGNTLADVGGVSANTMSMPLSSYSTPAYLITVAEIEFFIAEYEARYGNASAAAEHYRQAIEASCDTYGVAFTASITNAYPWNATNWKRCIGIQKWIHLAGCNNFESWCELRRLGYPTFGEVSGADIFNGGDLNYDIYVPGTLYTPYTVSANIGDNKILQRFPYPSDAAARNSNTPANKGDLVPVFWAE